MKKYNLKCFGCGEKFYSKEEVFRSRDTKPYCGECIANVYYSVIERDMENEWHRNNPGRDFEQEKINQANINKYGEC